LIPLRDDVPTSRLPIVTLALIAANVLVYLISIRHGGSLLGGPSQAVAVHYGAIPYEFTHPAVRCDMVSSASGLAPAVGCGSGVGLGPGFGGAGLGVGAGGGLGVGATASQPSTALSALSSMFLHAGPVHLLGNVVFLYIFGNNVEDSMGHLRFLVFYLLGGLAALGLQILADPSSLAPTIGASGAIAAVLGGYILLYPRAKVMTLVFVILFFTVVEIPAILMLGIWFAEQAVLGLGALGGLGGPSGPGGGGGVAYFAHVGGFLFGLLLIKLFALRTTRRLPVVSI
jgi:membrane associated rhomboid family serine protease